MDKAPIDRLAELHGIIAEYYDISGTRHEATAETKALLLRSLGCRVDTAEEIEAEIKGRLEQRWRRLVDPVIVASVKEQPLEISIFLPLAEGTEADLAVSWSITDESGSVASCRAPGKDLKVVETRWIEGRRFASMLLRDRGIRGIGYYDLFLECSYGDPASTGGKDTVSAGCRVIIAPDACYIPQKIEDGRAWGLTVNLYSIRSWGNWGAGDFTDLRRIVKWGAGMGMSLVGINPLHAIPNTSPFGISPYSPFSRLYKNLLYIDIGAVPEVMESGLIRELDEPSFRHETTRLRDSDFIDYDAVAGLKTGFLRKAFDTFLERHLNANTDRGRAFRNFVSREGALLESLATYLALAGSPECRTSALGATRLVPNYDFRTWPERYRTPSSPAVGEFKDAQKNELLFYEYIQWLIEEQMAAVAEDVKRSAMPVGLYHDLAVGSTGGGSDAWNYPEVFALGASLGAPPDDFNQKGQNWGFPPLNPDRLRETGYKLFIQTIRKNMQHFGALRIDHALGLFRLFWIPEGGEPKDGAYIRQPSLDLLRIIALESARNKTMIIAEDLGTMAENVREMLQGFRMFSYRLLYFERSYPDPAFLPPDRYPELATCAVTTHDLPTLPGFWAGKDIGLRQRLGIYRDRAEFELQATERERDKGLLIEALEGRGLVSPEDKASLTAGQMTHELCRAVYEYLSRTPCKIVLVNLDDVIGTLEQQNMPGTVDEYPNWRRKSAVSLEQMLQDRRFVELGEMFKKERNG